MIPPQKKRKLTSVYEVVKGKIKVLFLNIHYIPVLSLILNIFR